MFRVHVLCCIFAFCLTLCCCNDKAGTTQRPVAHDGNKPTVSSLTEKQNHCPAESAFQPLTTTAQPWSHAPQCVEDSGTKSRFCVYTSSTYNNGHGASFIATPETERELLSLIQNNTLTQRGKQHLAASHDLPYVVREAPGKGRGVFCQQPIRRGEVFLVGFPAVLIDQDFELGSSLETSQPKGQLLYELAFQQLPFSTRVLSLAHDPDGSPYQDIVRKNGFGSKLGKKSYSGVFPEIAVRCHKYLAIVRFSASSLSVEAVAIRDIHVEEELTISYTPPDLPTEDRLQLLESHYGFKCHCELCSAPQEIRQVSDAQRQRIQEIRTNIRAVKDLSALRLMDNELLGLVEREDLGFKSKEYEWALALAFYRLGDLASAIRKAGAALRHAESLAGGEDDEFQRAIRGNIAFMKRG
ncbi:hypothetical protein B0T16DRAFT_376314 [Cercophora newfieldiana]|uniref:SET domain-containing protein n=1 Tax=Cercophora newfieldiana TaxID=92897 RepID=A0AA39Y7K8_9PEZI|nr:hypothetical protein B0T16DRAFT_376314 [Cercophora newfieldiana]